jgi:hypothetical protein
MIGLMIIFIGIDSMKALVFTAVFNGVAAVPLIFLITRIAHNPKIKLWDNTAVDGCLIR